MVVELYVDRLVQGGDGIAELNGLKVFVRNAAPGELVRAHIRERKRDYWVAEAVDILQPSPVRIAPACPLFGKCGGCQFQHISYEGQLAIKQQLVIEAMRRVGHLSVPVGEVVAAPAPFRYRNKTQYPVGPGPRIGFYRRATHELVDVPVCLLHPAEFDELRQTISEAAVSSGENGYDEQTDSGNLRHIIIRKSSSAGHLLLTIVTRHSRLNKSFVDRLTQTKRLDGIVQNINPHRTNRILGTTEKLLAGSATSWQTVAGGTFRVSSSSFFQINHQQATALTSEVLRLAEPNGSETVLDLFCGVGLLALLVAPHVAHVTGVELDSGAIADARFNAQALGITNVEFIAADVAEAVTSLPRADLVLLDPPRKGCQPQTISSIAELRPHRIIYVSCNPVTLARDLAMFAQLGYAAKVLVPIDMFPQTYHIETVACLERPTQTR